MTRATIVAGIITRGAVLNISATPHPVSSAAVVTTAAGISFHGTHPKFEMWARKTCGATALITPDETNVNPTITGPAMLRTSVAFKLDTDIIAWIIPLSKDLRRGKVSAFVSEIYLQ
jgi:hypothetical protein